MKIIELRKISYKQAKREIRKYFKKHHGEKIDASDIQENLQIDILMVFEILSELEASGGIKEEQLDRKRI